MAITALVRNARPTDFPSIAALNADSESFLSPMNEARVERLHAWAAHHRVIQDDAQVAAFLLAFREGAAYDSPNYRWFARRYFDPESHFIGLGAGSAAKQARSAVQSSGALALLSMPHGASPSYVTAGQTYERFALRATSLGIAHHPIRTPIEVASYRADLLRLFGAAGEEPLLLIRLGHAHRPPPSFRRGVAVVASFRNS